MLGLLRHYASSRGSHARTLTHAVFGSAALQMLGMGATFLVGVQLARYLGPAGYGIYGTLVAIMALLLVVAEQGLPPLITREIAASIARSKFGNAKGALLWFVAITLAGSAAIVLVGLMVAARYNMNAQFRTGLFWALAIIPAFALFDLLVSAIRALRRVVLSQFYSSLVKPLIYALALFVAALTIGVDRPSTAMAVQLAAALLMLGVTVASLYRIIPSSVAQATARYERRGWALSAGPMMVTEMLRNVDAQFPILLLGLIASAGDVGIFRIALSIIGFTGVPYTIVNIVVMPYMARFHAEGDLVRLQATAAGAAVCMFAATGAITLGLYLFGQKAIILLFGAAYAPAYASVILLSLAATVTSFSGAAPTLLNMADREAAATGAFGGSLIFGIPLAWFLSLRFGLEGMAIAILLLRLFRSVILARAARRSLGVGTTILSAGSLLRLGQRREPPATSDG